MSTAKTLYILFGLMPLVHAFIASLMFLRDLPWVGVFFMCFSLLFGILFFGLLVNRKS